MDAYLKGLNVHEAAFAVKKYKSHHRVGTQAKYPNLSGYRSFVKRKHFFRHF